MSKKVLIISLVLLGLIGLVFGSIRLINNFDKELKEEIYFLREQIYEIAIVYNKSVKMDDITNKSKKHFREPIEIDGTEVQNINETFKTGSIRLKSLDTIDISKIKRIKKSNPSNKKQ